MLETILSSCTLVKHGECYGRVVWVNLRSMGHLADLSYVTLNVDAFVMNCDAVLGVS